MKVAHLIACFFLLSLQGFSQDTIRLLNPSFELNTPECGELPAHWIKQTDFPLSPGGIQPGCYGVNQPASDGKHYLSLCWHGTKKGDRVGQSLPDDQYLEQGNIYQISLFLARSETMANPDAGRKNQPALHIGAIALHLIGYNSRTLKEELLESTEFIHHPEWKAYELVFTPQKGDYDQIFFEAVASPQTSFRFRGNILLDHITPIVQVPALQSAVQPGAILSLNNPSFEGRAQCCTTPTGWYDCGPFEESPPDIQPGSFGVEAPASDGKTYLGLIARDNNTCESIGQRLPQALEAGRSYSLEVDLARSEKLVSLSRLTGKEVNLNGAVRLRVWGGNRSCQKHELLASSPLIMHTQWQTYTLQFKPVQDNYKHIILEVYYNETLAFRYNGNLLVDNLRLVAGE